MKGKIMDTEIKLLLDQLDKLNELLVGINDEYARRETSVVPREIKQQLDTLRAQRDEAEEGIRINIDVITRKIKDAVLEHGETVGGNKFQAVYNRGRISWDSRGLDGYMVAHPEISQFRREGRPSVSIREVRS